MIGRPSSPNSELTGAPFILACSESEAADGSIVATNAQQSEDNAQIFVMNNYFGIGLDADVSLEFHNKREAKPEKFNSRLHNKGVYFKVSRLVVPETKARADAWPFAVELG